LKIVSDLPTPATPKAHKSKAAKPPPAQPTHQLARLWKPSRTIQRIQAREGTTGEDYADLMEYKDNNADHCEWANLVGSKEVIAATIQEAEGDPKTVQEAQSRSDWPNWKEVMDCEISSLEHTGTWTTVLCPYEKNVVRCKWVFRLKRKADGSIDKYKACLVARGFTQIYSINYYDTYSPVTQLTSFCFILAIAACNDWEVEAFNFNSAYLNGELDADEDIYMQELPGYETGEADTVKWLLKVLYSLKQAGHKWYDVLHMAIIDLGFQVARADPRVFIVHIKKHMLLPPLISTPTRH